MLARKTSKNQLTLPKEIVRSFPDVDLFDAIVENNHIVLTPVKVIPIAVSLDGIRAKLAQLGVEENDAIEAVKWARS